MIIIYIYILLIDLIYSECKIFIKTWMKASSDDFK